MALEQRIIDPEKEAAELNRRITELENLLLETENLRPDHSSDPDLFCNRDDRIFHELPEKRADG